MSSPKVGEDMVARVGPSQYEEALQQPFARPMDFTKRPMKGWIYVAPKGLIEEEALDGWVARCETFNQTFEAK